MPIVIKAGAKRQSGLGAWVSGGSPEWAPWGGAVGGLKFKMPPSPGMPLLCLPGHSLDVASPAVFLSSQTGVSFLVNVFPNALHFPFEERNTPFITYPAALFPSV